MEEGFYFNNKLIFSHKIELLFHTKDWKRAAEVTNRLFVRIDLLFSHKIYGKRCENND